MNHFRNSGGRATLILYAFCLTAISSCNSEKSGNEDSAGMQEDTAANKKSAQKVFYSIPSPIQATLMLKKAGAQYSKELLNNPAAESKYTTNFSKSVNMGIYGADLAYCNLFNHTQEALNYLNVVNKLGNNIGLTGIIERAGILSRFQENLGNRDSLLTILSDLFRESDEYLKENGQYNTAAIVLAGGWVEGLYIAINQMKKTNEKEMRKLVAEQKLSLNSLFLLLPDRDNDKEMAEFKTNLGDLNASFSKIALDRGESKITIDTILKTSTVSGSNTLTLSDELLKEISDKVIALRTNLVK